MEIAILANGSMIRRMVEALMNILMDQSISEIGKTIFKMDLVWKLGPINHALKEASPTERNRELDSSNGPTHLCTSENSTKT